MNAPLNPTDIARETLRQLATHRTAPTPDNYRDLYHRIAGHAVAGEEEDEEEKEKELAGKLIRFTDRLAKTGQHGEIGRASCRERV